MGYDDDKRAAAREIDRVFKSTYNPDLPSTAHTKGLEKAGEVLRELVKSDGWETSYYDIPFSVKDVDDLIMHFELNWHMANILKACLRYGKKDGVTKEYDLNKIDFMSKREREHIEDAS